MNIIGPGLENGYSVEVTAPEGRTFTFDAGFKTVYGPKVNDPVLGRLIAEVEAVRKDIRDLNVPRLPPWWMRQNDSQ